MMPEFSLPPMFFMILGAFCLPFLKGPLKRGFMLLLPLLAFYAVMTAPEGNLWAIRIADYDLILGRIDRMSRVFCYIFTIISFIAVLFALKVEDDIQHISAFIYAGSGIGVVLAGDFFTLYIFWEFMAVASTFLILASRTPEARCAGIRYLLVHVVGGLFLLAGIVLHIRNTGSIAIVSLELGSLSSWLIFLGVAVNAAVPPLHPWLKDAYPEATPTGAVFLSAFTTKSAVYVMARIFAGTELLIWLGAMMTVFPIFYAVLENNIRRVLSYSLMNQVGFMLCGVGIGTALSINGTVSHAFCHILYKALLFMAAGSVLHMTGKIKCTDLGGLYKTMPLTCICCMVGSASISGFPLFSGFISKSMIISASSHDKLVLVWFMLMFASAGVIDHAGIKVPFFTFFSHDSGIRTEDPPLNMRLAMVIAAFLCVFIGVYPAPLYELMPYPVDYIPYTGAHIVGQLQLLLFGALAFCLLILSGNYPAEMRAINLDFDWFYRKGATYFYRFTDKGLNGLNRICDVVFAKGLTSRLILFCKDAPANLTFAIVTIFQRLLRMHVKEARAEARAEKYKIACMFRTGMFPAGLSVGAATLIAVLLFFLL